MTLRFDSDKLLSSRGKYWLTAVAAALVSTLTVVTVGVPSLLLLAGSCIFAVAANMAFSSLSGPTSWAAGIVIEVAILGAESGLAALLDPHAHSQVVYVLMLVSPLLAALVWLRLIWMNREPHARSHTGSMSGEPLLAFVVIVVIELMFEVVKLRGANFGLSWAMGGDARNHVEIIRTILADGGITLKELKMYPAFVNTLCAVLSGASGRANLAGGVLLTRDLEAFASTFILSSVALALLFLAAIAETVPRSVAAIRRLPNYFAIVLLAGASFAIGAFVLGLSLGGGYLSASGALVFVLASMVLGMRISREYSDALLIVLTLDLVVTVASWTVLVVVPAVALVFGYGSGIISLIQRRKGESSSRPLLRPAAVMMVSFACFLAVMAELYINRRHLETHLTFFGGIGPPNVHIFFWLGAATMAALVLAPSRQQRIVRLLLVMVFLVTCAATYWVKGLDPKIQWSYYSGKMLWLSTCSLVWVPFVLLAELVRKINDWRVKSDVRAVTSALVSLTGAAALFMVCAGQADFPFPLRWASTGSNYPSPQEVTMVIHQANVGGHFVVWDYASDINDRLGNFWSALLWDYGSNGQPVPWASGGSSFEAWGYTENGSFASLCTEVSHNKVRIVTSNMNLVTELKASCPGYLYHS